MFPKIYLEITNVCNFACSFCPPSRRKPEFMPRGRFLALLGRLAGAGDHLYFHVKGEPLLHPELGSFLALAGEGGFEVSLTTNGTLVGERAELLLGAGNLRKLSISLHSQVGEPGIAAYWRGVEGFLDLHARAPRLPVSLRLWNRREGVLPPETAGLWKLLRARFPVLGEWGSPGAWPGDNRLAERVYLNGAEEFDWPDLGQARRDRAGFCHGLGNQIAVLVDGTLLPCCLDGEGSIALGDLLAHPLAELLASPRARALREGFARGELVEELCRSCGYRRRFAPRGIAQTASSR